jgi:hypothetical protein
VKGVGHTVAQQQRSTQGGQGPGPSHPDVWRVLGYLTTDVTSTDSPALLSPLQCTFTFPAPCIHAIRFLNLSVLTSREK